jgi:hypothetical protein
MAIDHQLYSSPDAVRTSSKGVMSRLIREFAVQDWIALAYMVGLNVAALIAQPGTARIQSLYRMSGLLAFLLTALVLVRGRFLRDGRIAPLLYRLGIYGTVQLSYFFMHDLLPILNTRTLDVQLYQLDLALFGVEPAIAMDRWVTPFTTEWFAFFYFGYFFLLAFHVIPILMLSKRARLVAEFALGMVLVFCIGHTLYMMVPGYGPYRALAEQFRPFPEGAWLNMVMQAVASGGAQMDIFPSLHTAGPSFIALFSFRHRDKMPFCYTWPIVAFVCVNIIIATMFLRWHYVIDVVAGLLLACSALVGSVAITRHDFIRRSRLGLTESWPAFSRARHELRSVRETPDQFDRTKQAA